MTCFLIKENPYYLIWGKLRSLTRNLQQKENLICWFVQTKIIKKAWANDLNGICNSTVKWIISLFLLYWQHYTRKLEKRTVSSITVIKNLSNEHTMYMYLLFYLMLFIQASMLTILYFPSSTYKWHIFIFAVHFLSL